MLNVIKVATAIAYGRNYGRRYQSMLLNIITGVGYAARGVAYGGKLHAASGGVRIMPVAA